MTDVGGPPKRRTLLVVEDDPPIRELLRRSLQLRGYAVLEAADGEAAVRLCRDHAGPIHLLLTDVKLPVLDGLQVAAQARSTRPDLQVLLLSGTAPEPRVQASGLPLLGKPFAFKDLVTAIERLLPA